MMENGIKKRMSKNTDLVKCSRRLLFLGTVSVLLILSAASGYLFIENQELEERLNIAVAQKNILDAEIPDSVLKYAPLLVSSKDPAIKELAVSLGTPEEIYRFVRDNIEYSEDYDEHRMATEVLDRKQGDCLGKANLLAGLLLAYGYSSREVIVNMGYVTPNGERSHHAWIEFNYDGKWIVLDASQFLGNFEFNRWDRTSFYQTYQATPYAEFNDRYVQVNLDSNNKLS